MKKVLSIITLTASIAVLISACSSNSGTTKVSYDDTVGFAQFQAWKYMNESSNQNQAYNTKSTARRSNSVNQSNTMTSASTNNAKTSSKKKGWSKAAKYSAIGGGTGVILGAVINKRNRVAGGVIGGILGGGIGYGIGRRQDKRDGRY